MGAVIEVLDGGLDGSEVAYEPCPAFRVADAAAVCDRCGWAEDDHDAVVVEIGGAATATRLAS